MRCTAGSPAALPKKAYRRSAERHEVLKGIDLHIPGGVSMVTQDALLFSASIRDNLLYARPDATDEMM